MAMNTRIPLPGPFGEAMNQGMTAGTNMFNSIMGPRIQREQMDVQWQKHLREEARLREMMPFEQRLYAAQAGKAELEADPARKYQMLMDMIANEKGEIPNAANMDPLTRSLIESVTGRPMYAGLTPGLVEAFHRHGSLNSPESNQYVADRNKLFYPSDGIIPDQNQPEITPGQNDTRRPAPENLQQNAQLGEMIPHLKGAVSMNHMPAGRQSTDWKDMMEQMVETQEAKNMAHLIGQAREIRAANPNLYRKAVSIIVNPEAEPGKIDSALRALVPKEQLTPFLKLSKIYADILTKNAKKSGMNRSVYGMRLFQQTKPQAKNPDEVDELIFDNLLREVEPQIGREQALRYAMQNNLYLPRSYDYGKKAGETTPNQVPAKVGSPTPNGMMKGIINGKEENVHPTKKEAFIKAGGQIL